MKKFSVFILMFIVMINLILPQELYAIVEVDMTSTVEKNSMLILLLFVVVAFAVGFIVKIILDKMDERIKKAAELNYSVQNKLKETESSQFSSQQQIMSEKLNRLESECHACQKILPTSYVTKLDFEKFVDTHREDINNITSRLETIIKDLKSELRSDMETQIERIIALLNTKLQTRKED